MKKFTVALFLMMLLGFSGYLLQKTRKEVVVVEENKEEIIVQEPKLPDTIFSFKKDELKADCSNSNAQFCAIEQAVKCTINPDLEGCSEAKLPKFIFLSDSGIDRPSEINYKFTDKKILNNQNVEFYTDSTCNGTWFGLCHGRVIYVLAPEGNNSWNVKDIYAIEQ